jgi:hypothetical protein
LIVFKIQGRHGGAIPAPRRLRQEDQNQPGLHRETMSQKKKILFGHLLRDIEKNLDN